MNILLPLSTQLVAIPLCLRPDCSDVGARVRLGHRHRSDQLARNHFRKPALFLFGAARMRKVWARHVGVHQHRNTNPPDVARDNAS